MGNKKLQSSRTSPGAANFANFKQSRDKVGLLLQSSLFCAGVLHGPNLKHTIPNPPPSTLKKDALSQGKKTLIVSERKSHHNDQIYTSQVFDDLMSLRIIQCTVEPRYQLL